MGQEVPESVLSTYPTTAIKRRQLTSETNCEVVNVPVRSGKIRTFENCFLQGMRFLQGTPEALNRQDRVVEYLKNKWTNLPIYIITAHSAIEPRLELMTPKGMYPEKVKEEDEYLEIEQLTHANYTLNIARGTRNSTFERRSDFFEVPKGAFIINTSPMGYDAACGDANSSRFLESISLDNVDKFRNNILSENFDKYFVRNDENQYMMFTPPLAKNGINKGFSFNDYFDKNKDKTYTWDKWGIVRLDKIENISDVKTAFSPWSPRREIKKSSQIADKTNALNPIMRQQAQTDAKMKKMLKIIEASIAVKNGEVPFKKIVNTLGDGIYLDLGCGGIVPSIFDRLKNKYTTLSPDVSKQDNINITKPIFKAIHDSLETIARYNKLQWQNIVLELNPDFSDENDENVQIQRILSSNLDMAGTRLSKEIKKDYLKGIGGGKKKNKTRRNRKKREKKTRKKK